MEWGICGGVGDAHTPTYTVLVLAFGLFSGKSSIFSGEPNRESRKQDSQPT